MPEYAELELPDDPKLGHNITNFTRAPRVDALPVGPGQVIDTVLRWQGLAAKARDIRAMLPHVDAFRAGHSIATLDELADAILRPGDTGEKARLMAAMQG